MEESQAKPEPVLVLDVSSNDGCARRKSWCPSLWRSTHSWPRTEQLKEDLGEGAAAAALVL